ncbi:Hint domain-containing protein [Aliiroseovarius sp. KMU-50]|uniref:Hint domain-containing protein n=1 Tax=Aliiroseovarius salicola TaxID=3009082 RepID=A0ABT4VWX7_9RHOB|nr:Hint domain-containing protein [Aliiroseovarius sp. KMU-50]MDA5092757.1 Hint domain-containing protein [Aliiroseovarius sp. KMU-50]
MARPTQNTLTAEETAQAILGDQVLVVGASFTDPDMTATLETQGGSQSINLDGGSGLDVDFIATSSTVSFNIETTVSLDMFDAFNIGDVVEILVNGELVEATILDAQGAPLGDQSGGNSKASDTSGQTTLTLRVDLEVPVGELTSIRIAASDTVSSFAISDSAAASAAPGNSQAIVAEDDTVDMVADGTATVDVLANDTGNSQATLVITHIDGQPVTAGSTITLSTGEEVTLNPDGTLTIVGDGDIDGVAFSYTVGNGTGNGVTDTALVTLNSIPCFVAGTLIELGDGRQMPIETLVPGDMILTHDNGAQPLRWIGRRKVPAIGKFAPIHIAANTFGRHGKLVLSPQHRVLIRDALADLLFAEPEVLVAAKDLVNDRSVRRIEGGEVEYVHILFDEHQMVYSQGLATESFLPGPQVTDSLDLEVVNEICEIFPDLDPKTGEGYSPAARRTLRSYEAQLLAATVHAA